MPASSVNAPGRIFINYRREDSAYAVGWLYDRLVEDFGAGHVFKDIDSIQPGQRYPQKIMAAVESCEVFLAVIGRYWLTVADGAGGRRIDDPADFVRLEVEAALSRGINVIPVLVDGARVPDVNSLPSSLGDLTYLHAAEVTSTHFTTDVERLFARLHDLIDGSSGDDQPFRPGPGRVRPGFDAADFAARFVVLNPAEAARRLAVLPLDDAAVVVGSVPVSAAAEVLEVLLSDDEEDREEFAISLLAQIRRSKAQELIAAIPSAPPLLKQLPAAADAIEQCRRELGRGAATGTVSLAARSPLGSEGFRVSFRDGHIYWTASAGARVSAGEIARYHTGLGGTSGRLGFPVTQQLDAAMSQYLTSGVFQRFEGTRLYDADVRESIGRCGATVYVSGTHGAHGNWGSIGACYERKEFGTHGRLGFPVSDEVPVGPSSQGAGGTTGWHQRFEGGAIYYCAKTRALVVYEPIATYHEDHGGVAGTCGFPVSPRLDAATSPYGTTGHCQRFEGVDAYPREILERWPDQEVPTGATVYTSDAYGTHCVGWGNGYYYEARNGTVGWLGFPQSDEIDSRASEDELWATIQEFEGGAVFFKLGHGSVGVRRVILDCLSQDADMRRRIGFPVAEERSLAAAAGQNDDQIQFFEHGVVTTRGGVAEAWLRPG